MIELLDWKDSGDNWGRLFHSIQRDSSSMDALSFRDSQLRTANTSKKLIFDLGSERFTSSQTWVSPKAYSQELNIFP